MSPTFRFVGEWKDGAEHGLGTETWADGTEWGTPLSPTITLTLIRAPLRYVGMWENGEEHGQGTKTWADGSK